MAANARTSKEVTYVWEGKDKKGKVLKGEMKASSETLVSSTLRRQGISVTKLKKQSGLAKKGKVTEKDVTLFTRQLATMMKAGVPLLQSFDIVGKGHS
ncbi:MAG: type II secretion system F family protein, partial [Methylotenera sp.]